MLTRSVDEVSLHPDRTSARAGLLRYFGFAVVPGLLALAVLRFGPFSHEPSSAASRAGTATTLTEFNDQTLYQLLIAVAVIVGAAHLVGGLARRIGQPRVLGEMAAGLILGPSVLGKLFPGLTDYLFPAAVHSYLNMLAQLGVIFFMFLVGVELPLSLLRRGKSTALLVGHAATAIPFLFGVVTALFVPSSYKTSTSGGVAFAAFIGLCMSITAFPVLARILTDRKLGRTPLGALGMSIAGIGDVTVWCALAVVITVARGDSALGAALTIGGTVVFALLMWYAVRPLLRILVDRAGTRARHGVMILMLVVVLLSALATDRIGVHAIFGAFLAGLVVPRDSEPVRDFSVRVEGLTIWLMLPLFFAVIGLDVHFDRLGSGWWVMLAVTVVAVIGKLLGTILPARLAGVPLPAATRLGVMMNCRGLTEAVVLNIGVSLHIIGPRLFTVLIGMGVFTTLMTGPLLGGMRSGPEEPVELDAAEVPTGPGELIPVDLVPEPVGADLPLHQEPTPAPQLSVLVKKKEVATDGNA